MAGRGGAASLNSTCAMRTRRVSNLTSNQAPVSAILLIESGSGRLVPVSVPVLAAPEVDRPASHLTQYCLGFLLHVVCLMWRTLFSSRCSMYCVQLVLDEPL